MERDSIHKILIIKLSSLGDIIHSLPVPTALKTLYPGAKISFLVNRQYSDLLAGNPDIDEIFLFDRNREIFFFKTVFSLVNLIKKIRHKNFDLVIDLQGLLRSALITWLARGKKSIGFENAREGSRYFYQDRIPVKNEMIHAVDRYLLIPRSLGWAGEAEFKISFSSLEKNFIAEFLKAEKIKKHLNIIGIHPVARWPTKQWPAKKFAKLADLIQQDEQFQLVILGSADERPQIDEIIRRMVKPPVIATGKFTLKQLAVFMKESRLLITNDSGPMHLAAALKTPVLAIFGATDFHRTGPYRQGNQVIQKNIPCSPCLSRKCRNRNFRMECMETLAPEEVFEKFKQIVK